MKELFSEKKMLTSTIRMPGVLWMLPSEPPRISDWQPASPCLMLPVILARMDGASFQTPDVARGKALTSAMMCIGVIFLLPIWEMGNVAQGGAYLAVWFKTTDVKIKAIALPSRLSALLGITETAIFGVNLCFMEPFIAGLIGDALGCAWVVLVHVSMTAVGLTGILGMAIVQGNSLLNYVIGMVIAFSAAFIISYLLKYKTDSE